MDIFYKRFELIRCVNSTCILFECAHYCKKVPAQQDFTCQIEKCYKKLPLYYVSHSYSKYPVFTQPRGSLMITVQQERGHIRTYSDVLCAHFLCSLSETLCFLGKGYIYKRPHTHVCTTFYTCRKMNYNSRMAKRCLQHNNDITTHSTRRSLMHAS